MKTFNPLLPIANLFRSMGWRYSEKDAEMGRIFGVPTTKSGVSVDDRSAIRAATVYACVRVLSYDVATLPAVLYKHDEKGFSEKDYLHPLYSLLHDMPNEKTTAVQFWTTLMWHKLMRGCGYARIYRNGAGIPVELYNLDPDRIQIVDGKTDEELPVYKYKTKDGKDIILQYNEVFKVENPFLLSIVSFLRETIGLEIAQEEYAGGFFSNFAAPRGVVTFKGTVGEDEEQVRRWKEAFVRTYSGSNTWGVAVLENGAEFKPIAISNTDAQWLDGSKLTAIRICGGIGVPPHKIGLLDQAHYNNIEQQNAEYLQTGLMYHLIGIQQAVYRDLFTPTMRQTHTLEFLTAGLLRADTKDRFDAYGVARTNGWLSPNDIRRLENMNPIPASDGGDSYIVPLNMVAANMLGKDPKKPDTEKKHELNGIHTATIL